MVKIVQKLMVKAAWAEGPITPHTAVCVPQAALRAASLPRPHWKHLLGSPQSDVASGS